MATAMCKDIEEFPAVLRIKDVQKALRISRPKAYELAHTAGFPVVKIGRAFRIPRDAFIRWLEGQKE